MTKPDFTPDAHSMKLEISRLERQLAKAKNLFAQFYQVLGAHDANENALDAALAASDGNFDFELCPYVAEINVDGLREQLAKANERSMELEGQLQLTAITTNEASFESDYGKKFAIEKKLEALESCINDNAMNNEQIDALIIYVDDVRADIEQLRKEQSND